MKVLLLGLIFSLGAYTGQYLEQEMDLNIRDSVKQVFAKDSVLDEGADLIKDGFERLKDTI